MMPKVSIIILNWNGWEDTIECLESVYQIDYPNYDVILVDNGSQDLSVKKIREYVKGNSIINSKFIKIEKKTIDLIEITNEYLNYKSNHMDNFDKRLYLIRNLFNLGFTGGNNIGINFALEHMNPDYILLLNNDMVVTENFLSILINYTAKYGSTLTQPKIKYYHDLSLNSTGLIMDYYGYTKCRGDHELDKNQYDLDIKDDFFYLSGACLLIKSDFLKVLGPEYFDEKLFAYHEDVDISWIARLFGYNISYCPSSVCYHKGSKSTGGFGLKMAYWGWRNRLRVLIKNYELKNLFLSLPFVIIMEFITSIMISVHRSEPRFIFVFIKSIVWNLLNLKNTINLRKKIQKNRIINDSQIKKYLVKESLEMNFFKEKLFNYLKNESDKC